MRPSKDNTFCWFPFSLLALKEWTAERGIINASPCCNSIRPETPDPLGIRDKLVSNPHSVMPTDIFYGEEMESIRQAMREGRRHSACETCWRIEDRTEGGGGSYRMQSVPPGYLRDEEASQVLIDNPELQSIDFAFGENCNLRCRMCAPGLSNKLRLDLNYFVDNNIDTTGIQQFDYRAAVERAGSIERLQKYHPNYVPNSSTLVNNWADNEQWQNILDNIHTLKHIKATGGETLLSKPFIEFLDTAIDRGVANKIMLEFHTNATKFTNDIISKLVQFEGLNLNLSIDSVGKNYEYIRYPMPWSKLDASLRNFLERTRDAKSPRDTVKEYHKRDLLIKNFSFNVVLSALNAHYLPDLFEYQRQLVEEYPHLNQSIFYVDLLWPENKYINTKFLPPLIKQDLIDAYRYIEQQNTKIIPELSVAIGFLQDNLEYVPTEQDRLDMLREITAFDKSRNQSYNDYLHPDIIGFLETPR